MDENKVMKPPEARSSWVTTWVAWPLHSRVWPAGKLVHRHAETPPPRLVLLTRKAAASDRLLVTEMSKVMTSPTA